MGAVPSDGNQSVAAEGGPVNTARNVLRRQSALLAVAVSAAACGGANTAPDRAGPPSDAVGIELRTARPSYSASQLPELSLVLRNNGEHACALPSTADGTVEIVSVRRDDMPLIGSPGVTHYYDGIDAVVATGLRTIPPGESVVVPLDVGRTRTGTPRITSTVGTGSGAGAATTWSLDQAGHYRITASLSLSAAHAPGTATCPSTGTTADVDFTVSP
jgi:hypothetical protein